MSFQSLETPALLDRLPSILPPTKRKLETPYDALAVLVHTAYTILGFNLTGVDEDAPSQNYENNVLPEDWNRHAPGNYTFRYKHEQSSSDLLVKVVKLGGRTLVSSVATDSDKVATMDVSTSTFITNTFFPHDFDSSSRPLQEAFVSPNAVDDFISHFKLATLRDLMGGWHKEAGTEREDADARPSRLRESEAAPPARVQLEQPPRPEAPPYPPHGNSPYSQPTNPLEIGRRDRDPFPSNPFAPPPLFGDTGGEGMFVGPNHPIFGAGIRGGGPARMGPWGGDGYLPPLGAPPGARFDPVGPGIGPGAPFPGRGMPRGGGGPFGGQEPDNDDFPPPGSRDMFM